MVARNDIVNVSGEVQLSPLLSPCFCNGHLQVYDHMRGAQVLHVSWPSSHAVPGVAHMTALLLRPFSPLYPRDRHVLVRRQSSDPRNPSRRTFRIRTGPADLRLST